jgi:hypothetical protein
VVEPVDIRDEIAIAIQVAAHPPLPSFPVYVGFFGLVGCGIVFVCAVIGIHYRHYICEFGFAL